MAGVSYGFRGIAGVEAVNRVLRELPAAVQDKVMTDALAAGARVFVRAQRAGLRSHSRALASRVGYYRRTPAKVRAGKAPILLAMKRRDVRLSDGRMFDPRTLGRWLEYGTGRYFTGGGAPYRVPKRDITRRGVRSSRFRLYDPTTGRVFGRSVIQRGLPPRPWFFPPLTTQRSAAAAAIAAHAVKGIERVAKELSGKYANISKATLRRL